MNEKLTDKQIEDFNIKGADEYPVMPLRNTVLFPQQVFPIYIGRERSLKLINEIDKITKADSLINLIKALIRNLFLYGLYL